MDERKRKPTQLLLAALMLLVGIAGGYLVGSTYSGTNTPNTQSSSTTPTSDSKAADYRSLLNTLEVEHVSLAVSAARAGIDGAPDFTAAVAALDKNSNALADEIGKLYGPEARSRFYEIWNSHIGFLMDYARAAKAGDQTGMNRIVQSLNGYVEAISDFLSRTNENLPKQAVAQLAGEYIGLLKNTVDKYVAGDYVASYEAEHQARERMAAMAKTLAGAIVKQEPGNFQ